MAKYRLLTGKHSTADGKNVEVGAVVELTDTQYESFGDKFEPVKAEAPKEEEKPKAPTTQGTKAPGTK